jgi:hypothetical protein
MLSLLIRRIRMLIMGAMFRDGKFIPDNHVSLPENSKVSLTIEEREPQHKTIKEIDQQANSKAWGEFLEELEKINDEILPDDFPVRLKFRSPEALDLS